MKKIVLLIALLSVHTSAFAANGPRFLCNSKKINVSVKIQSLEQTPFSNHSIITINGKKYNGLRHQNLSMNTDKATYVYCISEKAIKSCSYSDEQMKFVELTFKSGGNVTLLNFLDRKDGLNVDCADGRMIW